MLIENTEYPRIHIIKQYQIPLMKLTWLLSEEAAHETEPKKLGRISDFEEGFEPLPHA